VPEEGKFSVVMARLRAGDPSAADVVFRRFNTRLIGLARNYLDNRLRRKLDPEDVLQSALRSFFLRQASGEFNPVDWDSLWSLLALITLRKCGRQIEHFRAACRDVRREQEPTLDQESAASWEGLASGPTPAEGAMLAETVKQIMDSLTDGRERQMFELSLQGFDSGEISARVGRSERTVQRFLYRIRKRLERLRDDVDDHP
jgi:RNA polymerase sigma-70 factor (ECF subfamily)